jgi:AcrR family transcriptional regulator
MGPKTRIVKGRDERRGEILDTAERLIYERGYERTPVSAIINAIGIAKGTFYHHFESKADLLDAMVRRLADRMMDIAVPALNDESLDAVAKFHAVFGGVGHWKLKNRGFLMKLLRALYAPENTALRLRSHKASLMAFAPAIERVVAQGVDEGVFHCTNPDIAVRLLFTLAADLGEVLAGHMLAEVPPDLAEVQRQIAAYNDAINRLLGAPVGTVELYPWAQVAPWFEDAPGSKNERETP